MMTESEEIFKYYHRMALAKCENAEPPVVEPEESSKTILVVGSLAAFLPTG